MGVCRVVLILLTLLSGSLADLSFEEQIELIADYYKVDSKERQGQSNLLPSPSVLIACRLSFSSLRGGDSSCHPGFGLHHFSFSVLTAHRLQKA